MTTAPKERPLVVFTPNTPTGDGARYILLMPARWTRTDDWQMAEVYHPDTLERFFVWARSADCGSGCRCAAEVRGATPAFQTLLRTVPSYGPDESLPPVYETKTLPAHV